jgi:RNA recognition motif-containing protein
MDDSEQVDYSNDVDEHVEEEPVNNVDVRNSAEQEMPAEVTLFVSRFRPPADNEAAVREVFEKFGTVTNVVILGKTAYVQFENAEQATVAKNSMHRHEGLNSNSLIVDFKKGSLKVGSTTNYIFRLHNLTML